MVNLKEKWGYGKKVKEHNGLILNKLKKLIKMNLIIRSFIKKVLVEDQAGKNKHLENLICLKQS